MERRGTEMVGRESSEAASWSEAEPSVASEDSNDDILDLEALVATVQETRDERN